MAEIILPSIFNFHFHTSCSIGFRYWKVELWKDLFTQLLNMSPGSDDKKLQKLRESFQDYMCSKPQFIKKLKELLVKQRASLCSA